MCLFGGDEAFEDGEHAFAVLVDAVEIGAEGSLIVLRDGPFAGEFAGDVDILTEFVERMAAEEEAVEKGRFALRGKRIGVVLRHDGLGHDDRVHGAAKRPL